MEVVSRALTDWEGGLFDDLFEDFRTRHRGAHEESIVATRRHGLGSGKVRIEDLPAKHPRVFG